MEENVDEELKGDYMEDLVEARIENAIITYDYAPLSTDVDTSKETSETQQFPNW